MVGCGCGLVCVWQHQLGTLRDFDRMVAYGYGGRGNKEVLREKLDRSFTLLLNHFTESIESGYGGAPSNPSGLASPPVTPPRRRDGLGSFTPSPSPLSLGGESGGESSGSQRSSSFHGAVNAGAMIWGALDDDTDLPTAERIYDYIDVSVCVVCVCVPRMFGPVFWHRAPWTMRLLHSDWFGGVVVGVCLLRANSRCCVLLLCYYYYSAGEPIRQQTRISVLGRPGVTIFDRGAPQGEVQGQADADGRRL